MSCRKKATCGQTQCSPSRKELCWLWTVSRDTHSLMEREYSRVYRTLSIQFGDNFRLVLSVGLKSMIILFSSVLYSRFYILGFIFHILGFIF